MALPVSIVIPACNRNRVLHLMAPTYFRQNCAEIVVVDDASNPPLEPIGSHGDTAVRWIRVDRRVNQPAARMVGARAATQPFVFFGEDDAFLSDGCIENLLRISREGTFGIVAPQWITVKELPGEAPAVPGGRKVTQAGEVIDYGLMQIDCACQPLSPIEVPWLHTPALMLRKTLLDIGFDPAYQGYAYREETDFYVRATAAGVRLAFVPGPPVFHYKGPINITGSGEAVRLLHTEYWIARNNFYFLLKNRQILRNMGATTRPFVDTLLLMGRRFRWYWRRLWLKVTRPQARTTAIPL